MSSIPETAITLYDFRYTLTPQAWQEPKCIEGEVRLVLNHKRIPYKTVWISHPEVETTLKNVGCSPTSSVPGDPEKSLYTLPAIFDTSATKPMAIAESLAIAEYLDAKYPDCPIFPEEGRAIEYIFEEFFMSTILAHFPLLLLPLTYDILDETGKPYFRETRESWIGKKLEEFSLEGPVKEAQWKAVEGGFDALAKLLEKNGRGKDFVRGGLEPTGADLLLVSALA